LHVSSTEQVLPVNNGFWSAGFWSGHGGMWSPNDTGGSYGLDGKRHDLDS
jgi:hypothetical protein